MSGYSMGLVVSMVILVAGCGTSMQVPIGDKPITLQGSYQKEYADIGDVYVQYKDKDPSGNMVVIAHDTIWSKEEKELFVYTSSYPQYTVDEYATIMNECNVLYDRYHMSFVEDPIQETKMYMSYMFSDLESGTVAISYVTPHKKDRKKRDKQRKDRGCGE